jgi:UTP--glucose-1-phosphate uridylyltransferase
MLPLVDKPVIQYSIEEAVAAGIEHVVVVTSSQKRPIEDHFDHNYELEQMLEEKGDIDNLRQKEQLGLGHAVLMAKEAIGHEPFAVMLPDDVVVGDRPCIGQLIDAYNRTHGSVVAVMEVPDSEVTRYGVIDPDSDAETNDERLYKVQRLVEKPEAGSAPSNLAIIGRYVLTPKIFERLESTSRGAGGEIQLTDAISSLISDEQDVYAYAFEGKRYDAGTTMGWLQASVELALERPDIGGEFRRFLSGLDLS